MEAKRELNSCLHNPNKNTPQIDENLAGMIKNIKNGQGWLKNTGRRMTLEDKFIVFGMMDLDTSPDMK